jgi:hypothetical protein
VGHMGFESSRYGDEELPESNLTGRARDLPEVYTFGSFDLYSAWVRYTKQHSLAVWLLALVPIVLFILVNL